MSSKNPPKLANTVPEEERRSAEPGDFDKTADRAAVLSGMTPNVVQPFKLESHKPAFHNTWQK